MTTLTLSPAQQQDFSGVTVLIQPGWHDSGPEHWQTLWQHALGAHASRIPHEDWEQPLLGEWLRTAELSIAAAGKPVIFVAHSLGCILLVHLARGPQAEKIAGAFLVAPADVERENRPPELASFAPIPLGERVPFPCVVVASDDDPWCRLERARHFADRWGADFHTLHNAGHITAGSGYGPWPEGFAMLAALAERTKGQAA